MYRHSPVRNPRSKGIKIKQVLQVCVLLAVCFWLIFQVKRSHDKKKEFDDTKISLNTNTQSNDEILKLGRKDIQPKLEKEAQIHEEHEEQEEQEQEQEHEKEDEEEEKVEEEKDDDEVDENEQEKETEMTGESEEKDEKSETEKGVSSEDNEEDETTIHTHERREEHYKADDASSAVTHDARILTTENVTLDNGETPINENGPPSSTTFDTSEPQNVTSESSKDQKDTGEQALDNELAPNESEESSNSSFTEEVLKTNELNSSESSKPKVESEADEENMEGNDVIEGTEEILDEDEGENDTHLEEKEVRMDLDTLPEIETEGGDSEDTAAE